MKRFLTSFLTIFSLFVLIPGSGSAASDMAGHDMSKTDKIGELFHESMVDGYMLSYYLMDLRDQKTKEADSHAGHGTQEMDKPHHIMVYIMDKNHAPVMKGKVGFMIKDAQGNSQKTMAMFMSNGFGITADMKQKGVYSITTKVVLGDVQLMDKFDHEIK